MATNPRQSSEKSGYNSGATCGVFMCWAGGGWRITISAVPAILIVLSAVHLVAQGVNLAPVATINGFDPTRLDMVLDVSNDQWRRHLESLSGVSKLDFKVPTPAHREYEKGARLLIEKKFGDAVEPLTKAISIYPKYVGAHNALGLAYVKLGKNEEAEHEFSQSITLDDHLPYSYLNLSWAQIALKQFPQAEQSSQKASDLAPLDLHLLTALAYAQLLNKDYAGVIATAEKVHNRKHPDAAIVHYLAGAASQGQGNLVQTQVELETFLSEAPQSPFADTARKTIQQIQDLRNHPAAPSVEVAYSASPLDPNVTTSGIPAQARAVMNEAMQQRQLAEVENSPEGCESCADTNSARTASSAARSISHSPLDSAYTLRSSVDEVALFFAATDHGKSVTNLKPGDVIIRDAGKPPARLVAFHNETELPLRLGLVIDTSNSIVRQFGFEQKAASAFLKKSLTGKNDLAFVVGFSDQVLLVKDFTHDPRVIEAGINQLAPAGGTALWDALKFAADKLGDLPKEKPLAKMLVVISDGEDNSSSATLKEAIESAERHEITVYTVSTRALAGGESAQALTADGAMKALAARTGGSAFFLDSVSDLDRRLSDLQQVIRSRYLVSFKPLNLIRDGSYHPIALTATKEGHKLHVYVRRGYYAPSDASSSAER
jgi:Ca-activated chloride channel homolog